MKHLLSRIAEFLTLVMAITSMYVFMVVLSVYLT